MCTVILKEQVPEIAEEDILVFKCCFRGEDVNTVYSPFLRHPYKKDVLNETDFSFTEDNTVFDDVETNYRNNFLSRELTYIERGFHSLDKENKRLKFGVTVPCAFIIPKGALFYKNGVGNLVSNQIIFKNII